LGVFQNFFVSDLARCLVAVLTFPLFLVFPGYLLGWAFDLLGFREESFVGRLALSVPLSIAVSGVVSTQIGRLLSFPSALRFFELLAFLFLALLVWELRNPARRRSLAFGRGSRVLLTLATGWMLLAFAALLDFQVGDRLYLSVTAYDHCIRALFARSVAHTGVPPVNPLYFPGETVTLRYFYFWNALCALPALLTGIDARLTMYASTVWCGIGMVATIVLYLKHFSEVTDGLRRKALIGAGLLAVTGLDLIPAALKWAIPPHIVDADMEWWSPDIVTGWFDSLLWVPHHVGSLIACLTGFLMLYLVHKEDRTSQRGILAVIAGLAFASAIGYSVYVTFTFALFMGLWGLNTLLQRRFVELGYQVLAGLVALVLSVSFLKELQAPASGFAFAAFKVHRFPDVGITLYQLGFNSDPYIEYINFLLLPVNYFIELGFFFAVIIIQWMLDRPYRWKSLSRAQQASWAMLAVSLFVTSFLRSQIINANDLAYRAVLILQFVALLWAVPLVEAGFKSSRLDAIVANMKRRTIFYSPAFLRTLLILGALGTTYQLFMLRSYSALSDAGVLDVDPKWLGAIGRSTYHYRTAQQALDDLLPVHAKIQANPNGHGYIPRLLYEQRQEVVGGPGCGSAFGGDPYKCMPLWSRLNRIYNHPKLHDKDSLDTLCTDMAINYLMVNADDDVWIDGRSWVWSRKPIYKDDYLRVIPCGPLKEEQALKR
jgi:hypothetical protein